MRTLGCSGICLLAVAVVAAGQTTDASKGKELFGKRCGGCHALDRDKEGPRLQGVYGRAAGSIPSFQYSEALRKSGITWREDTLDKWLAETEKLVPGNDMAFRVVNPDERREIIAFLKEGSEKQGNHSRP
jgi:cytochrome c